MCIRIYIFNFKKQTKKKKNKNTKKAKETKEEKRISLENGLKKKFAAARVKNFFVTRITRNKRVFFAS